jgi:hypothetical protein
VWLSASIARLRMRITQADPAARHRASAQSQGSRMADPLFSLRHAHRAPTTAVPRPTQSGVATTWKAPQRTSMDSNFAASCRSQKQGSHRGASRALRGMIKPPQCWHTLHNLCQSREILDSGPLKLNLQNDQRELPLIRSYYDLHSKITMTLILAHELVGSTSLATSRNSTVHQATPKLP